MKVLLFLIATGRKFVLEGQVTGLVRGKVVVLAAPLSDTASSG